MDRLIDFSFEILQFELVMLLQDVATGSVNLVDQDVQVACKPPFAGSLLVNSTKSHIHRIETVQDIHRVQV